MFDSLQTKFQDFNESLDDTGLVRKTTSAAQGKRVIDADKLEDALQELELALIGADVDSDVAQQIVDETRSRVDGVQVGATTSPAAYVRETLRDVVEEALAAHQFDITEEIAEADGPVSILFVGINGVGKTTTIAKFAYWLRGYGYSVALANGDTFRAGAEKQIEDHADTLGIRLIKHERGGDPAAVVYDGVEYAEANDVDVVLADTAGRLHTDSGLMDQLQKIERVVEPTYTVFVGDATNGQDAVEQAKQFSDAVDLDGAILTKVDATGSGGAVLSIPYATNLPLLFFGTGESYDNLAAVDPRGYANQLVGIEEE